MEKIGMRRIDIVMNQSIEEDFLKLCETYGVGKAYTKFDNVCGTGLQAPKMGTPIWPQLNVSFMIVCPEDEVEIYRKIVISLRVAFPDDGVFCTVSDAELI